MLQELLERTAAGLRNMESRPDGFLYCDTQEYIWDHKTIAGVPVFHSSLIEDEMIDENIQFIPIWNYESENHILERKRFNEGYTEYEHKA